MNRTRLLLILFPVITAACLLPGCTPAGKKSSAQPQVSALDGQKSGPPDWATCTISLYNIPAGDPQAASQAQAVRERISQQTGWKDLHIISTEEVIKVCRGYFENFTTRQAQGALQQVRNYTDPSGAKPYESAMFALLPDIEKKQVTAGPPQWDLRNTPGNSSLCIGFFINDELCKDRVAAALDKVKKLREQKIEAWFYHGEYRSGVYVGHFQASYQLVTVGKTRDGRPVTRLKFLTTDPAFATLREEFPHYQRNGQVQSFNLGGRQGSEASRLVPIPRFGQEIIDADVGL